MKVGRTELESGWVRREEGYSRDKAGARAQELGFRMTANRKLAPRKPGLIYFSHF